MIELEGRMLAGLDEFMLRLGHLKVLCAVAAEAGGSWHRINREAAKTLTRLVPVQSETTDSIADYLRRKRLCVVEQPDREKSDKKDPGKYRYKDLYVEQDSDGLHLRSTTQPAMIWWQDACIASPGIASRVGAITAAAKSGSKTGLSHINDWAQFVGLIGRAGELSAIGRLVVRLSVSMCDGVISGNPYLVGCERLALAFSIIGADIDCFSRLCPRLISADEPIRLSGGTKIFADTVQQLAQEARESRHLSIGRKNLIYENLRDLENAARKGKNELGATSTAWHRASSRLESYVDLGLLEKGRGGEEERYQYIYYSTPALERAAESLGNASNARDWLEKDLAWVLFGHERQSESFEEGDILADLPTIISSLARPTGPLPIDAVALGSVWLRVARGLSASVYEARQALERLAHTRPEIARLSRGGFGDRAEFISLDVRKIEGLLT